MRVAWRAAATAAAVCAAFLIAGYSAIVPAFEAPDEPGHFGYVQLLAGGHGLPVQGEGGNYDPEFSQPPLYYAFQAGLARLIPSSGARVPDITRQNVYQNTTAEGNVNLYSHPAAEDFPWTGQILQLHAMRLANMLFAAVTLLATFGIAREVGLSYGLALGAAATLALLPQFDFISGALNADSAITAGSAATLYLLLRWLNRPASAAGALLLVAATAAAMLSKLSGLAVLGFVLAVMLGRAWRERDRGAAGQAILTAALALILGGWWYARNLGLYGDVLGWQPMLTSIGAMLRPHTLSLLEASVALLGAWPTAIGVFGWNNLHLPPAAYAAVAATGVAGLGLIELQLGPLLARAMKPAAMRGNAWAAALLRRGECRWSAPPGQRARVLLLGAWAILFAASLVRWVEVNTDAAQWRLLLPAFPALVVLATLGLARLFVPLALVLPAGLGALSAASLLLVVRPAYTPDPPYTGPIQHPLQVRFGESLELAGYDDPQPRDPSPGQPVRLILYWRALRPLALNDVIDLAALDIDGAHGLKQSTWPQEGRAPTSEWQVGQLVRDEHLLRADDDVAPGVWTLQLDVFQPLPKAPRLAVAGGGTTAEVGRFLVAPPRAAVGGSPEGSFEGGLALLNHASAVQDGKLRVSLTWQAAAPVARDYTVFVHLLDGQGKLAAQSDSQPGGGRFPTSLLAAGMAVPDMHVLDVSALPAGGYQLEIGLYDAQTGQRLQTLAGRDAVIYPVTLP